MPHFSVATIEALGIHTVQLPHTAGEIRLRGVNQEMYVIVHQAVGMTAPTKALHYPSQGGQEQLTVLIVTKDSLACIPSRSDVIERTGEFDAEWTSYGLATAIRLCC